MWKTEPDQGMFAVTGDKNFWAATQEDADWLVEVLDSATNTVYKLFCQNPACNGFNGFITRAAEDAKKTVYPCDECGKPMTRKTPGTPGAIASEKPSVGAAHGNFPGVASPVITNPVITKQHLDSTGMARPNVASPTGNMARIRAMQAMPKRNKVSLEEMVDLVKNQGPSRTPESSPEEARYAPGRLAELESKIQLLDSRVVKLESEIVAQAETFQVMMSMVEDLSAGAKTT